MSTPPGPDATDTTDGDDDGTRRVTVFEAVGGRVTVSLLGGAPNAWVARFVSTLPERHQHDPDTLLVLFSLLARRTVTAQGLAAKEAEVTRVAALTDKVRATTALCVLRA